MSYKLTTLLPKYTESIQLSIALYITKFRQISSHDTLVMMERYIECVEVIHIKFDEHATVLNNYKPRGIFPEHYNDINMKSHKD